MERPTREHMLQVLRSRSRRIIWASNRLFVFTIFTKRVSDILGSEHRRPAGLRPSSERRMALESAWENLQALLNARCAQFTLLVDDSAWRPTPHSLDCSLRLPTFLRPFLQAARGRIARRLTALRREQPDGAGDQACTTVSAAAAATATPPPAKPQKGMVLPCARCHHMPALL